MTQRDARVQGSRQLPGYFLPWLRRRSTEGGYCSLQVVRVDKVCPPDHAREGMMHVFRLTLRAMLLGFLPTSALLYVVVIFHSVSAARHWMTAVCTQYGHGPTARSKLGAWVDLSSKDLIVPQTGSSTESFASGWWHPSTLECLLMTAGDPHPRPFLCRIGAT